MHDSLQQLHALLYANGGEMKKTALASSLDIPVDTVDALLHELSASLTDTGLELIITDTTASLRTARTHSAFLDALMRKDTEGDVGPAGLEVLAIVLYKGTVSRATIDYIRGVNSSSTLRQLVLRGLLERRRDEEDSRAWVYTLTPELLAHLGVLSQEELPEYDTIASQLTQREAAQHTHDGTDT